MRMLRDEKNVCLSQLESQIPCIVLEAKPLSKIPIYYWPLLLLSNDVVESSVLKVIGN